MTVEHKLLRQSHRKETARKKLVTASPAGYVPILAATKALLLSSARRVHRYPRPSAPDCLPAE
jgi:hypothetical protein